MDDTPPRYQREARSLRVPATTALSQHWGSSVRTLNGASSPSKLRIDKNLSVLVQRSDGAFSAPFLKPEIILRCFSVRLLVDLI